MIFQVFGNTCNVKVCVLWSSICLYVVYLSYKIYVWCFDEFWKNKHILFRCHRSVYKHEMHCYFMFMWLVLLKMYNQL